MENKRAYIKPILESETFVPQNYIAACGDSGVTYYFQCNAGEPYKYWEDGFFGGHWETDDHPYQVVARDGRTWYNYGPCNNTHTANSSDEFIDGYIDNMHTSINENISVKIWIEKVPGIWGGVRDNIHCTTNLNMDSWQTVKS